MNNRDLIIQYIDTGIRLPEYQVNLLPKNVLSTYLRKRVISSGINPNRINRLTLDEYKLLSDDTKNIFVLGIDPEYCYDFMKEINWANGNSNVDDDLVNRIVKLRDDEFLGDELEYLLEFSSDSVNIAYQLIGKLGDKLSSNNVKYLINIYYDEQPKERLTIATAILNKFKKGEQLNIENSPIDKLVFSLDPSFDLIKNFIDYNYSINGGAKIKLEHELFFTLFEYTNSKDLARLALYMQKYVELNLSKMVYTNDILDKK